jgi:uncharacterized protein YbbK (DUF523 family)
VVAGKFLMHFSDKLKDGDGVTAALLKRNGIKVAAIKV